jgi:hypothetical protein
MSHLWSPGITSPHLRSFYRIPWPIRTQLSGARSVGDDTVSHLHKAQILSAWSQDAPPLHSLFPVELTLHCNASEPFILPIFQGLAVSEADPLAYFESGT